MSGGRGERLHTTMDTPEDPVPGTSIDDSRTVVFGAPMLPNPAGLAALIEEALSTGWLTNGGVLHNRLEQALGELAGNRDLALVSSGTMALMMALRLGGLPEGAQVITSPLSFPATVQAIEWCGFRPVFADVDPETLTLCPHAVEAAVTPDTAAILPVHLLGVPCDVDGLAYVARRHGLWLVYDAAHAFGLRFAGHAIAHYGDACAFSLHATKLLHTAEGGYVTVTGAEAADRLRTMRNFGLEHGRMIGPGINGKLSELQAAMGLALLPDLPREIAAREALRARYDAIFAGIPGLRPQPTRPGATASLVIYGLRVEPALRAPLLAALAEAGIRARDPFPLLCGPGTPRPDARIITTAAEPAAPQAGSELLCLPFHGKVMPEHVARIAAVARRIAATRRESP